MSNREYSANIMLDLECTDATVNNPVLLELAAVHFDIDNGNELGHYTTIISYQSCLEKGLVDDCVEGEDGSIIDGPGMIFLKGNGILKETLKKSKASKISLNRALAEFTGFVQSSCLTTRRLLGARAHPRNDIQPMIWGNGAVADNVYV